MNAAERRIYLDYNASAPVLPAAVEAVTQALALPGNPSSVHAEGRAARAVLERARDDVAALCGLSPDGVVFTSGASEAATTALGRDWLRHGRPWRAAMLAVLDTDHPCLREGGRFAAADTTRLAVRPDGTIDLAALDGWLAALAGRPGLLALSWANSETGVIQPLPAVIDRIAGHDVLLVADAVQLAGRRPMELRGIAATILSAHKFGGPKGVGALVLADEGTRPFALMTGGGQERGRRSGTESLPLIAGMGAAARVALATADDCGAMLHLRGRLEEGLVALSNRFVILGQGADRLPNTVGFAHPCMRAETAQIAFDMAGIAVSAGSACSSGKVGPSHVLRAMAAAGLAVDAEAGAIRVSIGPGTVEAEIERFLAVTERLAGRFSAGSGVSRAA